MEHLSVVPRYEQLSTSAMMMSTSAEYSLMGCPRYEVVVHIRTTTSVLYTTSVTEGPSSSGPSAYALLV